MRTFTWFSSRTNGRLNEAVVFVGEDGTTPIIFLLFLATILHFPNAFLPTGLSIHSLDRIIFCVQWPSAREHGDGRLGARRIRLFSRPSLALYGRLTLQGPARPRVLALPAAALLWRV
jgi:hypothetical protein